MESKNLNKKIILLVDDEPDVLFSVQLGLESGGFIVDSYQDPRKALSEYRPGRYDLLIIDIKMPFINGIELCWRIRKIDPGAKICFLTAINDLTAYNKHYGQCLEGSQDRISFTQKPLENKVLLRIARTMIANDSRSSSH